MNESAILYPMLAHIALVLGLYVLLGLRKSVAIKSRTVNLREASLNKLAWPPSVLKMSNNITNQFESPILFHLLCLMAYLIGAVNILAVSLAWLYVVLRYIHSYIHTGSNFVPYRLRVFALSLVTILAMLAQTAVHLAGS